MQDSLEQHVDNWMLSYSALQLLIMVSQKESLMISLQSKHTEQEPLQGQLIGLLNMYMGVAMDCISKCYLRVFFHHLRVFKLNALLAFSYVGESLCVQSIEPW